MRDPDEVYGIDMHRVRTNEHAVQCATVGSTAVLVWLFHSHAKWPSEPRRGVSDVETVYMRRWVAEQYPTVLEEVLQQEAEST